jgi:type I site-specific restriction endonuclease
MDKKSLSERDICTKFISPALRSSGWDELLQIREEVSFTKGRIIVRGKLVSRGKAKRADYILYYKPNIPLALIEAKDLFSKVLAECSSATPAKNCRCSGSRLRSGLASWRACERLR